jgi:hypothetical protein
VSEFGQTLDNVVMANFIFFARVGRLKPSFFKYLLASSGVSVQ